MTTFTTQIFNCKGCTEKLYFFELTSYFISSSETYSDGYVDCSPPISTFNQVVVCPHCNHMEWKDDIETLHEGDDGDASQSIDLKDIKWKFDENIDMEMSRYYLELIKNGFANSNEREISIRVEIWRTLNHIIRYYDNGNGRSPISRVSNYIKGGFDGMKFSPDENRLFVSNLERLVSIYHPEYFEEKLLYAEMYRELGKFEDAVEVLTSIPESERDDYFFQIEKYAIKNKEKVFKLNK